MELERVAKTSNTIPCKFKRQIRIGFILQATRQIELEASE
jgi:hypothetical protein